MLSWSGNEQGIEIDLLSVQAATGGAAVDFAHELVEFATAATGFDQSAITAAASIVTARPAQAISASRDLAIAV